MNQYKLVTIDLAKHVFQICAFSEDNKIAFNKKVSRKTLIQLLMNLAPTTVILEACFSSNPWGRKISEMGHTVKLIPPFQIKPFVMGNKNDANDAVAIGEAALRPKATFVSVKTLAQQDLQLLLRMRERIQKMRIMTSNQTHGFLAEYGIVCAKGHNNLITTLSEALAPESTMLTTVAIEVMTLQIEQYKQLLQQEKHIEAKLIALCQNHPAYQFLLSIPGIGPMTAATLLSTVDDPMSFKNGRQFSAWIGLTPRQHASGTTNRMLGISKRGNAQLRKLLIHGARTVVNWVSQKDDKLSLWIKALQQRMHPNKVIVALDNKLSRIAWAVMRQREPYQLLKLV